MKGFQIPQQVRPNQYTYYMMTEQTKIQMKNIFESQLTEFVPFMSNFFPIPPHCC